MLRANLGNNSARSAASNSNSYNLEGKRILPPQVIKENILFKLKNNVKIEDIRCIAQQVPFKAGEAGPPSLQEFNEMKEKLSQMAHSMLIFHEVHSDVMDYLNGEL